MDRRNKKKILGILVIVILSLVLFLRYSDNPNIPGQSPYYHMKIARALGGNLFLGIDELAGQAYVFDSYDFALLLFSWFLGLGLSSVILPLLFNLLSVFLFYLILRRLFGEKKEIFFTIAALIISPIFIFTSVVSGSTTFYLFITLLIGSFLLKDRGIFFILSLALSLLIISSGLMIFLAFLLVIFSLFLIRRTKKTLFLLYFSIIVGIIYQGNLIATKGFINTMPYYQQKIFGLFVSDMGAMLGFDVFYIILGLIGLVLSWRKKREYLPFYFIFVPLLILTLFYHDLIIFLNLGVAYLVALAFVKILSRKWSLKIIKKLTVIIIVVGLFFSITSFMMRVSGLGPGEEVVEAGDFLKIQEQGVVLSHHDYGLWIQYFGEQATVLDTHSFYKPENALSYNKSNEIFNSYSLKTTKSLMDDLNISYIVITEDMRDGLVWTEKEQGLLFLLRNNETFKNIYSNIYIEVWKYLDEDIKTNEEGTQK